MAGRMVEEACRAAAGGQAAAGSLAERREEQAKYGGEQGEQEAREAKEGKVSEDYYEKGIQFECSICGLAELCQYFGDKPPFTKHLLEFEEDVYVMIDPFKARQSRYNSDYLVLGGACSACRVDACMECSVYFTKRFCIKCAEFNINEFPKDMQGKIVKQAGVLAARAKS